MPEYDPDRGQTWSGLREAGERWRFFNQSGFCELWYPQSAIQGSESEPEVSSIFSLAESQCDRISTVGLQQLKGSLEVLLGVRGPFLERVELPHGRRAPGQSAARALGRQPHSQLAAQSSTLIAALPNSVSI